MKNSRFWEVLLKVIVAAATAFLTALGTVSAFQARVGTPDVCCRLSAAVRGAAPGVWHRGEAALRVW